VLVGEEEVEVVEVVEVVEEDGQTVKTRRL
jgi:hypothetical protein